MIGPAWAATARTGPVRKWMGLRIFAIEGMIAVVDERDLSEDGKGDGEYIVMSPADLQERVKSVMRPYRNQTRVQLDTKSRSRYNEKITAANGCMECIKEARHMGDPTDPRVREYWQKHRDRKITNVSFQGAAKKDIHISGEGAVEMPAIKNKDGKVLIDAQAHRPNTSNVVYTPPRRKRIG